MRLRILITGLLLLCVLSLAGLLPAVAQQKHRNPNQPYTDSDGAKFSRYTTPVEIPDVPMFTGKVKMESGAAKETEAGTAYIQAFSTPEPKEYVMPWYESVLTSNNWKIVRKSAGYLSARKDDGSYCSVSSQKSLPSQEKEYRSSFEISYFKFNPKFRK